MCSNCKSDGIHEHDLSYDKHILDKGKFVINIKWMSSVEGWKVKMNE